MHPKIRTEIDAGESTCEKQIPATFNGFSNNRKLEMKTREDSIDIQVPMERLEALDALHAQGFIDEEEMQRRKYAIINQASSARERCMLINVALPNTIIGDEETYHPTVSSRNVKSKWGVPHVVYSTPPDFSTIQEETAMKHWFDYARMQWKCEQVLVKFYPVPFARGSLRVVYHVQVLLKESNGVFVPNRNNYVAKVSIDPEEDAQTYFKDIELQSHCAHYAIKYNEYRPPKKVDFVKAWVLEMPQLSLNSLFAVEKYIHGEYRKHNNNYGSVSDDERNTPQAFSHFTYEVSKHQLLAVDIQGVGDLYTDPQIHTKNGNDFGKGNLGLRGFQKFLDSHRCNPICRYLKLPSVNPKNELLEAGTIPVQALMTNDSIRAVPFESKHYFEKAPGLQKFITQCKLDEQEDTRCNFWCNGNNQSCTIT